MALHRLKTHLEVYALVRSGRKTFEFRKDDRGFAEGDKVVLVPWDPVRDCAVDQGAVVADVGFVLRAPSYGVPDGYCIFSLLAVSTERGEIKSGEMR